MKKYSFTWFYHHKRTDYLYARNRDEAIKLAVLIMRLKGGYIYSKNNIIELNELDHKFYDMEKIEKEYESKGKLMLL